MPKAKTSRSKTTAGSEGAGSNGAPNASNVTNISALQRSSASDSRASNGDVSLPSTTTNTSFNPSISEEQVRRRAYELYLQRGGSHGKHAEDWYRAEAELRGRQKAS